MRNIENLSKSIVENSNNNTIIAKLTREATANSKALLNGSIDGIKNLPNDIKPIAASLGLGATMGAIAKTSSLGEISVEATCTYMLASWLFDEYKTNWKTFSKAESAVWNNPNYQNTSIKDIKNTLGNFLGQGLLYGALGGAGYKLGSDSIQTVDLFKPAKILDTQNLKLVNCDANSINLNLQIAKIQSQMTFPENTRAQILFEKDLMSDYSKLEPLSTSEEAELNGYKQFPNNSKAALLFAKYLLAEKNEGEPLSRIEQADLHGLMVSPDNLSIATILSKKYQSDYFGAQPLSIEENQALANFYAYKEYPTNSIAAELYAKDYMTKYTNTKLSPVEESLLLGYKKFPDNIMAATLLAKQLLAENYDKTPLTQKEQIDLLNFLYK